jgi:prepilin-type N-terminal cleavage/methylation domain-containing protein
MSVARSNKLHGFTLVEMLISVGVTSIILAGLMVGVIFLQRSYSATEFYAAAQSDETRVMDYITREVRRALTISVSGSNTLNLTVPTYVVSGTAVTPTISNGSVLYSGSNTTISYTLNGSQVRRTANGGTALVIANHVSSFTPVMDPSDVNGNTVITTVTFSPKFQSSASSVATAGTTMSCKVSKRN